MEEEPERIEPLGKLFRGSDRAQSGSHSRPEPAEIQVCGEDKVSTWLTQRWWRPVIETCDVCLCVNNNSSQLVTRCDTL